MIGIRVKITEIIIADKTNISIGKWSDQKIKKADFPMSHKRKGTFPITRKWRWNTINFNALNSSFVVLSAYHKDIPEFQAVLAERVTDDTRTLARYEFHGNHPVVGWHVHAVCGDISSLETGITKPYGQKRIPSTHNVHRRADYFLENNPMNDIIAYEIVANRFGLPYTKDLLGALVT